ncbi:hypothetical protein M0Q97_03385 [Candidatus Dojkabacteria bacterium]|jgi:hypothetical protein|nr:hypothetical protein [Candidatus Dojkabacteria bacterium]
MNKIRIDDIQKYLHNIIEPLLKKRTISTYTTAQETDILVYIETELSCLGYINEKDYYKKCNKKIPEDISELYVDQAPYNSTYGDRNFFSTYLELGLKRIDNFFSTEIQLGSESKYTKDELTKMIRRNPHLHNLIKENLLDNLEKYK